MPAYRIVKLEPTLRIVTGDARRDGTEAAAPSSAAGDRSGRFVRFEPSYRIVDAATPHAAAPNAGALRAALAPTPPAPSPDVLSPPSAAPASVESTASDLAQAQLRQHLIDSTPDAVLLMSAAGTIVFANATCADMLGYQPDELAGKPIEMLVPADARAAHSAHRTGWRPDAGQRDATHRPMARITKLAALAKDGRSIPVDVAVKPLGGKTSGAAAADPVFVVSLRDATEHQALVRGLEQLATTDPLTVLLNRRSFQAACLREFERFRRQGTPLSVMALDIDHFKSINDRYGHDIGDKALVQLSSTCLAKLRRTDVMARLGGEEFAILMPGSKPEDAAMLAERLRVSVSQIAIETSNGVVAFTVSIGLAEARPSDANTEAALGRADQALYEAKRSGRNRVVIAPNPV